VIARLTTARALGWLVVALVVMAAMVAMGRWQFGVYDSHQRADAEAVLRRPAVPLDSALRPDQAFPGRSVGVPVVAKGRYDRHDQLYVRGFPGARDRSTVVTPLVTPSGSAVLVLRGSGAAGARTPAPAGPVRVTGVLEPSQAEAAALGPHRTTDGIWIAGLVSAVRPDLYAGYVVLTHSDPPETLRPVAAPLPNPPRWTGLRNLLYAVQWWIFAVFVGFMWWRISTDDPGTPVDDSVGVDARTGRVASTK
jgi:cytochrome oxidase assembly protein ShyY1